MFKSLSFFFFLFFCVQIQAQSVYEKNKLEIKHCHSCVRPLKKPDSSLSKVEIDLKVFKNQVNPLDSLNPYLESYKDIYTNLFDVSSNKTIILLDELKFITYSFGEGHTTFYLNLLVYNDLIIYTRLSFKIIEGLTEKVYLKEITIPLSCTVDSMEYYIIHNENLATYKKVYPNFLLDINSEEYSIEELDAFYNMNQVDWNIDAFKVDDIFTFFGNNYMKTIIDNKEYEIIEKLLYSFNPVTRIYAYVAMRIAMKDDYKINNDALSQMKKIKEIGLKFEVITNTSEVKLMDFSNKLEFK